MHLSLCSLHGGLPEDTLLCGLLLLLWVSFDRACSQHGFGANQDSPKQCCATVWQSALANGCWGFGCSKPALRAREFHAGADPGTRGGVMGHTLLHVTVLPYRSTFPVVLGSNERG